MFEIDPECSEHVKRTSRISCAVARDDAPVKDEPYAPWPINLADAPSGGVLPYYEEVMRDLRELGKNLSHVGEGRLKMSLPSE